MMSDSDDSFEILDVQTHTTTSQPSAFQTPSTSTSATVASNTVDNDSNNNGNNTNTDNENANDDDDELIITSVAHNSNPHTSSRRHSSNSSSDDVIISGEIHRTPSPDSVDERLRHLHEALAASHQNRSQHTFNYDPHEHVHLGQHFRHYLYRSPRRNDFHRPTSDHAPINWRNVDNIRRIRPSRNVTAHGTGSNGAFRSVRSSYLSSIPDSPQQPNPNNDPDQESDSSTSVEIDMLDQFLLSNFGEILRNGMAGRGRRGNYLTEDIMLQIAQLRSMDHYHSHLASDCNVADIKLVDVPDKIKSNANKTYTSTISKDSEYTCAMCETELGIGFPKESEFKNEAIDTIKYRGINDTDRALSARLFFATCGHVYCGWCVSRYLNRKKANSSTSAQASKKRKRGKAEPDTNSDDSTVVKDSVDTKENSEKNENDAMANTLQNTPQTTLQGSGQKPVPDDLNILQDGMDEKLASSDIPRLVNIHVPATCVVKGCKRQIRPKTFKEFFL